MDNYASNVVVVNEKQVYLYIPDEAVYSRLLDSLNAHGFIRKKKSFARVARRENLPRYFKTGRFLIRDGMSNKELVRKLILGEQEPVRLVIAGRIHSREKLAAVLSARIAADSLAMLEALQSDSLQAAFGFSAETFPAMFLPNTYLCWWNISPCELLERLHREYLKYWTEERTDRAAALGLSRIQVSTLASIVDEETTRRDEMPRIAGVYLNRLRKNMPLQADPTLKFAMGDFSLRRILNRHKKTDSPYNTYKYAGLPPGPICIPSLTAIEAVLHAEQHDYLFFCAKDDFSGYHSFSSTLSQHNAHAHKYHQALNREGL